MRQTTFALFITGATFVSGCSIGSTAEMPRPRAGGAAAPNVAAIPTVGAELLGFAPGELVSRASLVRMDPDATCFDLVVRVPRGLAAAATDDPKSRWHLTLDVDGRESARFDLPLRRCGDGACLPAGSPLAAYAHATDEVVPIGERFCVEHVPTARRELALVEHERVGTATFRFRFHDGDAAAR